MCSMKDGVMTTTAALLDPATELQACLETITAIDTDTLGPDGQAGLVQALSRVVAAATAKKLQALASAERSRTAAKAGAASTGQWAARLTNSDQVAAQRQVRLAQGLDQRPAAQAALARGLISPEHAEVIVRADHQLPARGDHGSARGRRAGPGGQGPSPGALRATPSSPPSPGRDRGRRRCRGRARERAGA